MGNKNNLEPKDKHKVSVNLELTAAEAQLVEQNLKASRVDGGFKIAEEIEMRRELNIMREVRANGGVNGGGIEKTIEKWSKEKADTEYLKENTPKIKRYKLRYR